jgi:vancomycin resistance protein VanJ
MFSGRPLLVSVVMLVVLLYGGLATLHVVLRQVAGDEYSWLYVANLVAVVLWAPAFLLLPLALLGRSWWPGALLGVLPVVAWVATFGPYVLPARSSTPDSATAKQIRVIAWNVRPRDPSVDLAALIAESRPDIVMLEELPGEYLEAVVRAAPGLPFHFIAPIAATTPGSGATAVLSRWPIVGSRVIPDLPAGARTAAVVTVDVDGTRMDVLPLHLASPLAGRGARDLGRQARLRVAETKVIAGALREDPTPLLVGGDLNSSMANTPHRLLTAVGLNDLQAASGSWLGTTRRKIRVDWLLTRGLSARRAWTGNARNSDHRPVLADVSLPGR